MASNIIQITFCGLAGLLLSSCGADWERESVAKSPDGRLQAVVEYMGSAACCSDHSRLRLVELSDEALDEPPGIVVEATRATLRAHWENNDQLIVEACGATNYEVTARLYRREIMRSDGSENAVRLDVISIPDTKRNGIIYCATSDPPE